MGSCSWNSVSSGSCCYWPLMKLASHKLVVSLVLAVVVFVGKNLLLLAIVVIYI